MSENGGSFYRRILWLLQLDHNVRLKYIFSSIIFFFTFYFQIVEITTTSQQVLTTTGEEAVGAQEERNWRGGEVFNIILSSSIASIITFVFCLLIIFCLIRKFITIQFTDFPSSPPTVSILIIFFRLNETSKIEFTFYQAKVF